ncbi:MAG: hypothetical protein ABIN01_06285 [Ferruginibacter sp.]
MKMAQTFKLNTFLILISFALNGFSKEVPTASCKISADTDLKQFEGFFRLPNKVAYIQIVYRANALVATQLWDGKEYSLVRKSDLEFESDQEEYKGKFTKDSVGVINGFKLNGRIVASRVNYDPRRVDTVSADKLKLLEGTYKFRKDPKLLLQILQKDGAIILNQLWDNKSIAFQPFSELSFFNKQLTFPLEFIKAGGEVVQVVCFANDVWEKIK